MVPVFMCLRIRSDYIIEGNTGQCGNPFASKDYQFKEKHMRHTLVVIALALLLAGCAGSSRVDGSGRRRRIDRWRHWRAYWWSGRWDGWCCGCRWADWCRGGRNYSRRYKTWLVLLLAQAPSPLRTLLNALSRGPQRSRVKAAPELTRYRAIRIMSAIGT
jgi:hypothetical protein